MGKIIMHSIKQLCPSCGKEHIFKIEENDGLRIVTSCPNTGKRLTATVEIIAKIKRGNKLLFWAGITLLGYSMLVGCADFITGHWEYGILMIICTVINFFIAKTNANY